MIRPLLFLTLLSAPPLAKAQSPEASGADPFTAVRNAANVFYTELRAERIWGLPSEAQMKRLAPHMTPELASLIERARVIQQKQMKEHPDEKPNWIEGDLFGSLFEGVTKWELGKAFDVPGGYGTVKASLTYTEDGQKPVTWTDTLLFKERQKQWRLDDIRMGGEWAFKGGASLRSQLPGGGKDDDDHESPDEKWKVTFKREGETVTKIAIQPAKGESKPQILFGNDGEKSSEPAWVVWSPSADALAIRVGSDKKHSRTLVYRHAGKTWQAVKIPEFYPAEKKTMRSNGFHETDSLIDAKHWQDADTLTVSYYASFTDGNDGDGWLQHISVRIDAKGSATIVEAMDQPGYD